MWYTRTVFDQSFAVTEDHSSIKLTTTQFRKYGVKRVNTVPPQYTEITQLDLFL